MSKYIAAIPLADIERIAIVTGNGRSMAQVKGGRGLHLQRRVLRHDHVAPGGAPQGGRRGPGQRGMGLLGLCVGQVRH